MSDLFSMVLGNGLVYGFLIGFTAYFIGYAFRLVFNFMRIS